MFCSYILGAYSLLDYFFVNLSILTIFIKSILIDLPQMCFPLLLQNTFLLYNLLASHATILLGC